jgi:hypothetical protein
MNNKNKFTERPEADVVTAERLAGCFDIHRSGVLKWLKKNGFVTRFIRLEETGNQRSAALNRQEALAAINLRKSQGFKVRGL